MKSPEFTPITTDRLVTVAVDIQNDFTPGGSLAVTDGDRVIAPMNDVMQFTREHGGLVVATRDWHPRRTKHFDKWPVHCVAQTDGAAFHPELDLRAEDTIVSKGTGQTDGYSGFEGETPDRRTLGELAYPRRRGETITLMIGGLATDYCVRKTVLDSLALARRVRERGDGEITTVLVTDAIAAVDLQPGDGQRAIEEMLQAQAIALTSAEIINGAVDVRKA